MNKGTARLTREGNDINLSHEERHPNDDGVRKKNKGINYSKGKAKKIPSWASKHDVRLAVGWNSIYNAMELGDACPKCETKGREGTIIWKGRTKHRPLHPRCNNGCLVIFTGDEINTEEEE
tara:strand:- start:85 stop:447 length:363 start_codon:yes stop_codon:yes gene_type:complete